MFLSGFSKFRGNFFLITLICLKTDKGFHSSCAAMVVTEEMAAICAAKKELRWVLYVGYSRPKLECASCSLSCLFLSWNRYFGFYG